MLQDVKRRTVHEQGGGKVRKGIGEKGKDLDPVGLVELGPIRMEATRKY